MTTTYSPIFTGLGINPDQADLYTSLIQNGPQTAVQLAKNTSVKRTYVYKLCEQLVTLGLIRQEIKGKTTTFVAENPDKLLDIAENQKRQAETAAHSLENILPTLKSQFAATDTKPIITYYEGLEGVKKVYLDTLKEAQPIYALLDTSSVHPEMRLWLKTNYVKQRVKAGIFAKVILASGNLIQDYQQDDPVNLRETRVVNKEAFSIQHEIDIYGHKTAIMMQHKEAKQMVGIIIDNKYIADTLRALFDLAWLSATTSD